MKKILSLVIVLSMAIVCCACGEKAVLSNTDSLSKTDNDVESTTAETVSEIEQTTVDYRSLSNEDFAQKVAEDFSTKDVIFKSEKYDEDFYLVEPITKTEKFIDASIGFSDYGNHITLSFITDGGTDECYDVLFQALRSDLFNISIGDQTDICTDYLVDKIDYEQGRFSIKETKIGNSIVIIFQL